MFVEDRQRSLRLPDGNELLSPLENDMSVR